MNKTMIFIAMGVGLFLLMGSGKEEYFTVPPGLSAQLPQGGTVPASQLPSLGFVKTAQGWFHQTQLQPTGQYAGTDPASPQWLAILMGTIAAGTTVYNIIGQSGLIPGMVKTIKSTAVSWPNSVTANIKIGTMDVTKVINPATVLHETSSDGEYSYSVSPGTVGTTYIRLYKMGNLAKEAFINWPGRLLNGFDAGSVSGVGATPESNAKGLKSMF